MTANWISRFNMFRIFDVKKTLFFKIVESIFDMFEDVQKAYADGEIDENERFELAMSFIKQVSLITGKDIDEQTAKEAVTGLLAIAKIVGILS